MAKVVIVGSGAIGRGFLPWVLPADSKIIFVDSNMELVNKLKNQNEYSSYLSNGASLIKKSVQCNNVFHISQISSSDIFDADICFIAVGPRNVESLPFEMGQIKGPIFCLENDPATTHRIREILSKEDIYFGVPDVITSSTASPDHILEDPLSLHTENGTLYLSKPQDNTIIENLPINASWCSESELALEWDAKLFIHNTPHCIAAYLGASANLSYVHEAMENPKIKTIITGIISEVVMALEKNVNHELKFLNIYAAKELSRFSDNMLFDPISRVARHPLRKLRKGKNGRLIGACSLCLAAGVFPKNIITGIAAALHYNNETDDDYNSLQLISDYGIVNFLYHFLGVEPNSTLSEIICSGYNSFNLNDYK